MIFIPLAARYELFQLSLRLNQCLERKEIRMSATSLQTEGSAKRAGVKMVGKEHRNES